MKSAAKNTFDHIKVLSSAPYIQGILQFQGSKRLIERSHGCGKFQIWGGWGGFRKISSSCGISPVQAAPFTLSFHTIRGPFVGAWAKSKLLGPHFLSHSFTASSSLRWWQKAEFAGIDNQPPARQRQDTEDSVDCNLLSPSSSQDNASNSRDRESRRIFILGAGNNGKFVAHAIAGIPDRPPITLIFRSVTTLRKWKEGGGGIAVVTDGFVETRHNFDSELLSSEDIHPSSISAEASAMTSSSLADDQSSSMPIFRNVSQPGKILHLIVSIKAPFTVRALSRVAHRLSKDSTILFFPGGMGLLEEVDKKVFPDEATRPTYVNGMTGHILEAFATDPFAVNHAGMGTIALGASPRHSICTPRTKADMISSLSHSARYLIRTLTRIPLLAAVGFSPTDIFQLQAEKLAIKAVISPLSVVFDCRNGELLGNLSITRVIRLQLAEISLVIRALPELQGVPNVSLRFSPERLEALVVNSCVDTTATISPMLMSVESAQSTEIDYLNGYIVRRGEEMGIKCLVNYMIMQIVKGKGILQAHRNKAMLPIR